jgi:hypothetical protein
LLLTHRSAVPDLYSRILPAIDCPESSILTINVSVIIIIIVPESEDIPKKQKIKKHTQIWIQDIPSSTSPTWSSRSDAEKEVCFNWKTKD